MNHNSITLFSLTRDHSDSFLNKEDITDHKVESEALVSKKFAKFATKLLSEDSKTKPKSNDIPQSKRE